MFSSGNGCLCFLWSLKSHQDLENYVVVRCEKSLPWLRWQNGPAAVEGKFSPTESINLTPSHRAKSFHFRCRLTVNQSEGSVSMFPTALALCWLPLFPLLFKNLPSQQHSEHLNPSPQHDVLFGNQQQMDASENCFQLCCTCDRHFVRNTRSVENRMIKK